MQAQQAKGRSAPQVDPSGGANNFRPLVTNFARREVRARYKRSLLGWLWSLINPISTVLIYALVFGVFLRAQPPVLGNGNEGVFAVYLFTGLVVWTLFSGVVNGSMDSLAGVMDLRKKVFFPTETAILGGAIATAVQTAFEVAVLYAIFIVLWNVNWTFILLPLILAGVASFGLGIGLVISVLNAKYRDVRYLTGITLSLVFFLAPIVYPTSILELNTAGFTPPQIVTAVLSGGLDTYGLPAREIVEWNPISVYVQSAHDVVYYLRVPSLGRIAVMLVCSIGSPLLGLPYFRSRSMAISEEL